METRSASITKMSSTSILVLMLVAWCLSAPAACAPASAADPPPETALERYVHAADESYSWKVVSSDAAGDMRSAVVDMVSQTWRGPKDVDRAVWQHWLAFAYPEKVRSPIGFLFIGGGRNGSSPPDGPSERVQRIAQATGTAVAELHMVPNQPLVFHGDGEDRVEDDLIGYTWDQFLKTGDPSWPAQNAMAKSAVRAMDTMTALMASATGGGQRVDRFVVAGGSKRGWTTWLTGAVDKRVVAIVPIVIDVLNVKQSMLHHFAAYGFWAPSVGDYVHHGLMERLDHPRLEALYQLVDPYSYRHRLTMPKFVLNAAGDQFFLPDSSQFYWDGLEGEKCLRYVPNADHGLEGSDALESLTAFYTLILAGRRAPEFSWREEKDGALSVSVKDAPQEVRLWQATNPRARDFRVETLGRKFTSTVLESRSPGVYVASVPPPEKGWTAYFVELTYEVGAPVPLKLTTNVRVAPDVLPYRDRDSSQPGTVTVVCAARDEDSARAIVEEAGAFVAEKKFSKNGVTTKRIGTTCYLNWRPSGSAERGGRALTEWLRERGAEGFRYQLESGETITME